MATPKKKMKRAVSARVEKLVNRVIERILEEPRRFDMHVIGKKVDVRYSFNPPPCGTVGCLAGWALIEDALMRKVRSPFVTKENEYGDTVTCIPTGHDDLWQKKAEKLFGIPLNTGDTLFRLNCWPARYQKMYRLEGAGHHGEKAKAGAARLRHFIRTGK